MQINFNLRIDEELNEELQRIAQEQGRSKNKQIEMILKEFVKEYREKEKDWNKISPLNIPCYLHLVKLQ